MRAMRRTIVTLSAIAVLALVGCGGLGVNIGSGTSRGSAVVNLVGIQVQSGPNVPQVVNGHTLLLIAIAYYQYGSQNYVSSTQGAIFTTPAANCDDGAKIFCGDVIRFMDPSCTVELTTQVPNGPVPNPLPGSIAWWTTAPTVSQNVCILGVHSGVADLYATVKGVTGHIQVTVL